MDLFTYLLGKKGKNSLVHKGDLFSYLLGRNSKGELKTATGTNIYITDAIKTKINKLLMTKESTQDGTPSPDYPQEVKTVKGYRNLFDKENVNWYRNNDGAFDNKTNNSTTRIRTSSFEIEGGKTYKISGYPNIVSLVQIRSYNNEQTRLSDVSFSNNVFTLDSDVSYIHFMFSGSNFTDETNEIMKNADIQIVEGTEELPYVPYGTNWIYTAVSNGTDTNYYTIPLNDNEIAGIGNYKDELIVDKNGKCWLNKKIGKYVISGNENMEYKGTSNDLYAYSISNFENYENNVSSLSNYFKTYNTYGWSNALNRGISICLLNYGTSTNRIIYIITDKTSINDLKQWLQDKYNNNIPVILYYVLATPQLIDLNYNVDIKLFKGINNISNSEDMDMTLKYY